MNVYMIHHEEDDHLVLATSYQEAIHTLQAHYELYGHEPDSIACLGEAILPAQGEANPFACIECGAPAPLTRGHKPGCHQGMDPPRPGTLWEVRCLGCGALEGRPHHEGCVSSGRSPSKEVSHENRRRSRTAPGVQYKGPTL